MRVDEAGCHGPIAQNDHLCAIRPAHRGGHFGDDAVLDADLAVPAQRVGDAVE